MARPVTKLNPVKKTYNLEKRTLELLAKLAREDKRSLSQFIELLIEKEWVRRHGKKK